MRTSRGRKLYQSIDNFKLPGQSFSFFIIKGHHNERSIKPSSANSQQLNLLYGPMLSPYSYGTVPRHHGTAKVRSRPCAVHTVAVC